MIDPSNALADHPVGEGLRARDVVDDIARRLAGQLAARGATATLTVTGPVGAGRTTSDRAHFTNELEAEALVSIGCTAVAQQTGALNCDVHPSTAALLRESRAPAVSIEVGFLSNPDEAARLADPAHRHAVASALADAVQQWAEEPVD